LRGILVGLDRDIARLAAPSLGWHVHYEVGERLHIELARDRETAIGIARTLMSENLRVLRLIGYDSGEIIGAEQLKELCTRTARRRTREPYRRRR
jgi:hypothetical protein